MRGPLVIASAIGGLGEVVGSVGVVCRPGDAEALTDCMSAIIAHREEEHAQVYQRGMSKRPVSNLSRSKCVFQELACR